MRYSRKNRSSLSRSLSSSSQRSPNSSNSTVLYLRGRK
jgi:hypothetical protein